MEEKTAKWIVYILNSLIAVSVILLAWRLMFITKIIFILVFMIPIVFVFRFKNWARIWLTSVSIVFALLLLLLNLSGFGGFSDSSAPTPLSPYVVLIAIFAIIVAYFLLINKDIKKLFQNDQYNVKP